MISEIAELVIGTGAVVAARLSYDLGRCTGRKKAEKEAEVRAAEVKYVCDGCKHPYSYHEGENGACGHTEEGRLETRKTIARSAEGKAIRDRYGDPVYETGKTLGEPFPCSCKKYTGDVPYTVYV